MDGLSLLCNLHADGPLALRRLRAAGVNDLSDLESLAESTLSACLRSAPGQARRFVEEARQLALRLAESPLEPETSGEAEFQESLPVEEQPPAFIWRGGPRPRFAPAGHALRPGVIDGLDQRTCERLVAEAVLTLESLHERASLALARSTGIPLARLLDLASRARLALSAGATGARSDELVPEAPRRAPDLEGRSVVFTPPALQISRAGRVHACEPGSSGPFG